VSSTFAGVLALMSLPLLGLLAIGGPPMCVPRTWRAGFRRWRPRGNQRSARIGTRLRRRVVLACRNRCVYCHARGVQVDHIVPWAAGGLTRFWNLAGLCGNCNKIKSDYFTDRHGRVRYRGFEGYDHRHTAALILAAEIRHRHNPLRYVRAALAS